MRMLKPVVVGIFCVWGASVSALPSTVSKTDDVSGDMADRFIDGRSVTRTIEFTPADFAGQTLAMTDFQIGFSFLKSLDTAYVGPGGVAATDPGTPPFLNDIQLEVTSPGGATVILVLDDGGLGNGSGSFLAGDEGSFFRGMVVFDQNAANQAVDFDANIFPATANVVSGSPGPGDQTPTGNSYNPASNAPGPDLDAFLNLDPIGVWSYTVSDAFAPNPPFGDGISLYNVTIDITTESAPSGVPEPATLTLLLAGVFAGGVATRRRRRSMM